MKINVTWNSEENSNLLGKNCAKKAVLDLIETKLAIMVNSNRCNQDELLNGAKSVLGTAPIIGYSSDSGIIVSDGYIDASKHNFASIFAMGDYDTKVGTAISPKIGNERDIGRFIAKQAMDKVNTTYSPSYYLMFVATGDEEEYEKGIRDIIGDVPFFGGNVARENSKIFTEDMILTTGVAIAFFYTNKKIENLYTSKYHETVNSGVITKITGKNELDEIDGIKALKRYCEWTEKKIKDVKEDKIIKQSILKPLAVKTSDGSLTIINQPLNGNNDYSISLSNKVSVNTAIIQMQISKEELISSPTVVLRELKRKVKNKPKGYLLFQNYARKDILNKKEIESLTKKLKEEAGDVPFILTFTSSEYGRGDTTSNHIGKLMISEIAICD